MVLALLKRLWIIIACLLALYLFINSVAFLWNYVKPEGFWSFWYFVDLSRFGFVILIQFLGMIVFMVISWNEGPKVYYFPLLFVVFLFTFFIQFGPQLWFSKKMDDIFSYQEQVDEYILEGRYEKASAYAEKIYQQAIEDLEEPDAFFIFNYWRYHSETATLKRYKKYYDVLLTYGYTLKSLGLDNERAKKFYEEAKITGSKYLGDNIEYRLMPSLALLQIYISENDHRQITETLNEILNYENENEFEDLDYSLASLSTVAAYNQKIGNIKEAIRLRNSAFNMYKDADGSNKSRTYLLLLITSSFDAVTEKKYNLAEESLQKAGEIVTNYDDENIYVLYLNALATLKEAQEDYSEALTIRLDVLNETEDRQGKNSLHYTSALQKLASLYIRTGSYKKASRYSNEALEIMNQIQVYKNASWLQAAVSNLIIENFSQQNIESEKLFSLTQDVYNHVNENLVYLTEDEREHFVNFAQVQISTINALLMQDKIRHEVEIFNNILALNKIAFHSSNHFKEIIAKDSIQSKQYRQLIAKKQYYDKMLLNKTDENAIRNFKIKLNLAEKDILSKIGSSLEDNFKIDGFTWNDIQAALSENQVFIHFTEMIDNPKAVDKKSCYAIVVKPKSSKPEFIKLATKEQLEQLTVNITGSLKNKIDATYSPGNTDSLLNLAWKPVAKQLQDADKLYISKTGILNFVSFAALGIEDEYTIEYLSSIREIAAVKTNYSDSVQAKGVLYGGIKYDATSGDGNSDPARTTSLTAFNFDYLPFSKEEVDTIHQLLYKSNVASSIYSGDTATETLFKELSHIKPDIIHLATHGYYFSDEEDYRVTDLLGVDGSFSNPMLRSGLIFSKSNNTTGDDGILTAQEISRLNLSNTKLVVLSACESGLGDSKGEEGIFGLQRALKIAGVENIVMSLWKVPDQQTSLLMTHFYDHYLAGATVQQALQYAQGEVKKEYSSPFYWAGFVAVR
jgi:CHAT domain-containing protein